MPPEKPIDRRRFFREGLRELLKPLSSAIEPMERVARHLGSLEPAPLPPPRSLPPAWHRPPGALPEPQFGQTCSRCGDCVRVCPAACIKIDTEGRKGDGLPYIDANEMPCVLCDGLLCMPTCPTGALLPTPLNHIDMGTALWNEHLCLRSSGEDCTICVDSCPIGTTALSLDGNRVRVEPSACTGCGVCQNKCPTNPKSIVVIPNR